MINWDAIGAIGELLGSIAVVITLVYLVRQLKSSEIATTNASQSSVQTSRVAVNNQRFEHIELILRANSAEALSDVEQEQLRYLLANEQSTMFFTFLNFRRLGNDGKTQAHNFALFLHQNPSMAEAWESEANTWGTIPNNNGALWRKMVSEQLTSIQQSLGGT